MIGTITQHGFDLISDIGILPLQYSADVSITFIKDEIYTGYTAIPSIGYYDGGKEKVVEVSLIDNVFKLPAEVFRSDGEIAIAIALSNGEETIVIGTVALYINKAPGGIKILPSDRTWENLVISVMQQYNEEEITPKIENLMTDVKHQQDIVDDKVSDLDIMVTSGAFDGSYWLSGYGVPENNIGRYRDWYIDISTERWLVYKKDENEWIDTKTYLRGERGNMGGDTVPVGTIVHYAGDEIANGWLLCDGREIDRNEYHDLFDVIGTSYGDGDGSTTFNLPSVTSAKVIIKAMQIVAIVAQVENTMMSNSEVNAPSIKATKLLADQIRKEYQNADNEKQNKVLIGTTDPTSSIGSDGDLYIKIGS